MNQHHNTITEAIAALADCPTTNEGFANFTLPIIWTAGIADEAQRLGFGAIAGGDEQTVLQENEAWILRIRTVHGSVLVAHKFLPVSRLEASVTAKGAIIAANGQDDAIGLPR